MAGGDRERDADEETRNQMMQNLFGDQSEDEDDADDDDVAEMVDEDDGHQPQSPPQSPPQRHQELDDDAYDDEEEDARSHAPARASGYHSVSLPVFLRPAIPIRLGSATLLFSSDLQVAVLGLRFSDSSGSLGAGDAVFFGGGGGVQAGADLLEFY
jgi:hypothetical protein